MTRDLDWGVPVPVEGADGKVLYVWLDAPIGYITSTMEWCEQNGQDWRDWWQDPSADLLHFIGKDNIVFQNHIFAIARCPVIGVATLAFDRRSDNFIGNGIVTIRIPLKVIRIGHVIKKEGLVFVG